MQLSIRKKFFAMKENQKHLFERTLAVIWNPYI